MNEALAQRLRRQEERHADKTRAKLKTPFRLALAPKGVHPLRALRVHLRLSQMEMAVALGRRANFQVKISAFETGKFLPPQAVLDDYARLAREHGAPFDISSVTCKEEISSSEARKAKATQQNQNKMQVGGIDTSPATFTDLSAAERIPEDTIEYHDAHLSELLMRIDDKSLAFLEAAHALAAQLHRGGETLEKCKRLQNFSQALTAHLESAGQLKNFAFQTEVVKPKKAVLDANLNAEAQAWKNLLAANPGVNKIRDNDTRVGELIFPILQLARVDDESTPNLADVIHVVVERERDPLDPSALTRRLREARERIE